MSDDFDFDFDVETTENTEKVDTAQKVADTSNTKSTTTKKRSGRSSGKKSGGVTRQTRVPMHQRMPLTAGSRPGFVRRVVNDRPGRIDRFKLAGWTVVEDETLGDKYAGQASSVGSLTSKPVGGGMTGILMEIPEEMYHEDQTAKMKKVDETERAMIADSADSAGNSTGEWHGEIKISG
jgi:hypothetical protein